jgi:hypothetical protein
MGPRSPASNGGWSAGLTVRDAVVAAVSAVANFLLRTTRQRRTQQVDTRTRRAAVPLYDTPCPLFYLFAEVLGEVTVQSLSDLILGHRTHNLLDDLPVLEYQQGGNTANVIASRGIHGFVHIQFHHL